MDITSTPSQFASAAAAAASTAAPIPEAEDRRTLIQAVHAVNEASLYGQENELSFAMDRATQRSVLRIVDRETRKVVQQIPSEQVLRLAEELQRRG